MTIRVAINGYGRIGRNVLRAHYEAGKKHDIQIVAINDLGDSKTNAHLTQYDTAHGRFPGTVAVDGDHMVINGDKIKVLGKGVLTSKVDIKVHAVSAAAKAAIEACGGSSPRNS